MSESNRSHNLLDMRIEYELVMRQGSCEVVGRSREVAELLDLQAQLQELGYEFVRMERIDR